MAAATGMNIGAISDPQQRAHLSSGLKGGSQQPRDCKEETPPTFLVTQSLVSLLTEKGIRYRYTSDRMEHEAKGERGTCERHSRKWVIHIRRLELELRYGRFRMKCMWWLVLFMSGAWNMMGPP